MNDSVENRVDDLTERLRADVGKAGAPATSRDPVNQATIRNWCDAMAEANPYFTDAAAAAAGPHGGIVAPPAMLNAWPMAGLRLGEPAPRDLDKPDANVYAQLEDAGFTGVVATNSDLYFDRYLQPGDLVTATTSLLDVSEQKTTRLGTGHFVTTEAEYTDQNGERVGALRFRILKYAKTAAAEPDDDGLTPEPAPRPLKPRPRFNQDQAWFWDGLRDHELRIQRFTDDGTLLFPPANANPNTQSMDYDWIVASGSATLYSHTVVHYPKIPSFDYPHIVGLVELEEGVRIITNIVGVTPDQLEIGMPLELCFADTADDVTLHQFRPAPTPRRKTTLSAGEVSVSDALPLCPIPITTLLVVSTALATRDFQEVHHDRDVAQSRGSDDIFMNILTTTGLVSRWIGDWAGDDVIFNNIKIGLGTPNYPGDLMTLSGSVTEIAEDGTITIGYIGRNSVGAHVTGTADITLPTTTGGAQ